MLTAGDPAGVTLADQLFVERGAIAVHANDAPSRATEFTARIFWLGRTPRVLIFLIAAFVAVAVLRWPLVPVLFGLGPISVLVAWLGTLAAWRVRA